MMDKVPDANLPPARPRRPQGLTLEGAAFGALAAWGLAWWAMATGWPLAARVFPLVIAVPFTLLSAGQFLGAILAARRPAAKAVQGIDELQGSAAEVLLAIGTEEAAAAIEGAPLELNRGEIGRLVVALFGFAAATILIGFVAGLALGVFLYVLIEARAGIRLSLTLAAFSLAYLYLLTEVVLTIPLPEPLIVRVIRQLLAPA
jgi:hypothetical protein